MKTISNNKLIRRNIRLSQILTTSSLVILLAGLAISFIPALSAYWNYSFLALLLGFVLSQFGIYFSNRFGRSPRPDERLSQALKGLDDKYTLYHYLTPVSHLLLGPAGIWVLLPYSQAGTIQYNKNKNRWIQKGGNAYLKIFAQESLGRPDLDMKATTADLESFLKKEAGDMEIPPVQTALVFTNPKVSIDTPDAPAPTVDTEKLKDLIRRYAKEKPASAEKIRLLQKILPTDSID